MKKAIGLTLALVLVLISFAALAKTLTVDDIRAMSGKELSDLLQSYLRRDGKNYGKPWPKAMKEYFGQFGTATVNPTPTPAPTEIPYWQFYN